MGNLEKKYLLRMDAATWKKISEFAIKEERSINAQINYLIKKGIENGKKK